LGTILENAQNLVLFNNSIDRLTTNQKAVGSNPARRTPLLSASYVKNQ